MSASAAIPSAVPRPGVGHRARRLVTSRRHWNSAARWSLRVFESFTYQSGIKLLSAIAGLLIVRMLPKPEYALFAIAFQMQGACNSLADLGIGMGVSSIGGRVHESRRKMGELLTTALQLRKLFAGVALSICLPITIWMLMRNGADLLTTFLLCLSVANLVVPQLSYATLRIVPWLHGQYRPLQRIELAAAAVRLGLIFVLAFVYLDAVTASLIGGIAIWSRIAGVRRLAYDKAERDAPVNEEYRRELIRLSAHQLPNAIYYCFQGQIALLILTWFGNTEGIADVAALARLAVLLQVVRSAINGVLSPQFARAQSRTRVRALFAAITAFTALAFVPLLAISVVTPKLLLWLLGSAYGDLAGVCVIAVLAGCIREFGMVIATLNRSKAWIGLSPKLFIPVTVVAQIAGAMMLDLQNVQGVLWFQLVTTAAGAAVFFGDSLVGLWRMDPPTADSQVEADPE